MILRLFYYFHLNSMYDLLINSGQYDAVVKNFHLEMIL